MVCHRYDKNYREPGKAARRGIISEEGLKGVQLLPGEVKERDDLVGRTWHLGF